MDLAASGVNPTNVFKDYVCWIIPNIHAVNADAVLRIRLFVMIIMIVQRTIALRKGPAITQILQRIRIAARFVPMDKNLVIKNVFLIRKLVAEAAVTKFAIPVKMRLIVRRIAVGDVLRDKKIVTVLAFRKNKLVAGAGNVKPLGIVQ